MSHNRKISRSGAALILIVGINLLTVSALAQSTGGIFGPVINEGHQSVQYRAAFVPDSDAFGQRIHYQRSLNGDLMWRVVAQTRKTVDSDIDFDFVQGELYWQLADRSDSWLHGVRFDIRVRGDGRPGQLGFNWTNQFRLNEQWHSRFLVLTAVGVGDGASDGILLQTRASVTYKLPGKREVGLEMFSSYGTTSDFASFDDQRHQLGPYVSFAFAKGWSAFGSILVGLSDAAPDEDWKLWVTRSF